jgi:hypothetical protein
MLSSKGGSVLKKVSMLISAQHRSQIEAKSVNVNVHHPVTQNMDDESLTTGWFALSKLHSSAAKL